MQGMAVIDSRRCRRSKLGMRAVKVALDSILVAFDR